MEDTVAELTAELMAFAKKRIMKRTISKDEFEACIKMVWRAGYRAGYARAKLDSDVGTE